ncbi:MAG: CRISPR-associated endoribonuclease Cas6 [Bacteroidetes bacterium SW_11_45_7]|nr:MAG: CRISPR-associated endoribonuclease Cas6 [Bacteroidetes bacterium SW_11_45_7]
MRFQLTLTCNPPQIIPLNYQYPLSAWIYKVFSRADERFANWLHQYGYQFTGNRKFKLFTFSQLNTPKSQLTKDKQYLRLNSPTNTLILSFYMEEAASNFVKGLFQDQEMYLGDRREGGRFRVHTVERLEEPSFGSEADFRAISPIVVSLPKERTERLYAQYLSPEDEGYGRLLIDNLVRRYAAANQRIAGLSFENGTEEALLDLPFDPAQCSFELLSKTKSGLQTIKGGTPRESKVRGYFYRFRLRAPADLLQFAHAAGFGEKGSTGFGCVEVDS